MLVNIKQRDVSGILSVSAAINLSGTLVAQGGLVVTDQDVFL